MQSRTVSIVIGLVLVLGIGFFVYKTKQPIILYPEVSATPTPAFTATPTPISTLLPVISGSPTISPSPTRTPTPTSSPSPTPTPAPTPAGITMAQISLHNSRSSCWSAINGSVYDLTSWIPNHPGGENRILIICGRDGSNDYNGEHAGSSKTANILMGFKIGTLAQ